MKIGLSEVVSGIEYIAINKIVSGLTKEGFIVKNNYSSAQFRDLRFDIYAEKNDDKRIYELKLGKNKIQKKRFEQLQAAAKQLGAKLYIVYLEVPRSKEIIFDNLNQLIYEDLLNDYPIEIEHLSTQANLISVDDIELETINLSNNIANITGSGTLKLYTSISSIVGTATNSTRAYDTLDFFFRLSIDITINKITKKYYKFDIADDMSTLL